MSYKVDCPHCGWVVRRPSKLDAPLMECPACGAEFEAIFVEDIVAPAPEEFPIESNPRLAQHAEQKRFFENLWVQIIIIVVLAGGVLIYSGSCFDSKKQQENRAFIEATKRLETGGLAVALQGYQNFVRDFPSSPQVAVATTQIQQIGQRLESQRRDASARAEQQQASASRANQETMIAEWEEARRNPSRRVPIKWTFKVYSYREKTINESNLLFSYTYQIRANLKLGKYPVVIYGQTKFERSLGPVPKPDNWPDTAPSSDDWIIVEGFASGVDDDGSVFIKPTRITNIGYKGSGDEAN